MTRSLCELFSLLDVLADESVSALPESSSTEHLQEMCPGELFAGTLSDSKKTPELNKNDAALISGLHSSKGIDFSLFPDVVHRFYELSVDAFDTFVSTWMSELPLEAELLRFGRKVVSALDRHEAERIASNLSDADVRLVHEAAYKVWHEIHRMLGLLRFTKLPTEIYTAHCEPDHFILPALGEHFSLRFGNTPWIIIDDKRGLCLSCLTGEPQLNIKPPQLEQDIPRSNEADCWEKLWLNYHQTINNESRNNPDLQRQFMPKRYWKNLPEMKQ